MKMNFGASNDGSNYIRFGHIDYLNGMRQGSVAFRLKWTSAAGTEGAICGNKSSAGYRGWAIRFFPDGNPVDKRLNFIWGDGTQWNSGKPNPYYALDSWDVYLISWDLWRWGASGIVYIWQNGVYSSGTWSPNHAEDWCERSDEDFAIGSYGNNGGGLSGAIQLTDLLIWPGVTIGYDAVLAERDDNPAIALMNGVVPYRDKLKFWWNAKHCSAGALGGYNAVTHEDGGGEAGTAYGSPTLSSYGGESVWTDLEALGRDNSSVVSVGVSSGEEKTGAMTTKLYNHITAGEDFHCGLEIDMPNGEVLRSSDAEIAADEARFPLTTESWSNAKTVFPDREFKISPQSMKIVVADRDRYWAKYLSGEGNGLLYGSGARIKIITPELGSENWLPVFSGIAKKWEPAGGLPKIVFTLGPNDQPLKGYPSFGSVSEERFVGASAAAINSPLHCAYGHHINPNGGAIQCINYSTKFSFVSVGHVPVKNVYEDGELYFDWGGNVSYIYEGGVIFTVINLTSAEIVVTVELDGVNERGIAETDLWWGAYSDESSLGGVSGGNPIKNPAQVLLHALSNFYYGSYMDRWITREEAGVPIDMESFSAAYNYFAMHGAECSMLLKGDKTGYQFLSDWSSKWRVALAWNKAGKLQFILDNPYILTTDPMRRYVENGNIISPLQVKQNYDALASKVIIDHAYKQSEGGTTERRSARDFTRDHKKEILITNDWSEN